MATRIVILGRPGVGKTTLVRRVSERFPGLFRGFYTEEIREKNVRTGFRIVTLSGEEGTLALRGASSPFRVGNYAVFPEELEEVALPELEEAIRLSVPCLVDELGKMEFFSQRFAETLKALWESVPLLLATTRFPEIPEVRGLLKGVHRFLLTPQNREAIFSQVVHAIEAFTKEG
ncbi:MAG: nucleoside-triphosphatase [Atribacterota bacterium]